MMNVLYIIWSEQNTLGIPIIDEQHRGIVSTINSLYYLSKTTVDAKQFLEPILITLEQYTKIHFQTENQLMKEAEYPDLDKHLLLHGDLYKKTMQFSVETNKNLDLIEVLRFLKGWWLDHIIIEDKKYVPFLKKLMTESN